MALGASWAQGAAGASEPTGALDPVGVEFFENRIRPLLVSECIECHGTTTKQKGGLVLDRREGWARGGDSGPAIIPGDPEGSRVYRIRRRRSGGRPQGPSPALCGARGHMRPRA